MIQQGRIYHELSDRMIRKEFRKVRPDKDEKAEQIESDGSFS